MCDGRATSVLHQGMTEACSPPDTRRDNSLLLLVPLPRERVERCTSCQRKDPLRCFCSFGAERSEMSLVRAICVWAKAALVVEKCLKYPKMVHESGGSLRNSYFPKLPEAQNPLPEKPSGPRSGPESYSNGGFGASGNFGKNDFLTDY